MSKQYKKLQKKIYQGKNNTPKKKQKPIGHDYLLIGIFIFTVVVTVISWQVLTIPNRIMYILLAVSFALTYTSRHFTMPDETRKKVAMAGTVSVVAAIVMFVIVLFIQFTK